MFQLENYECPLCVHGLPIFPYSLDLSELPFLNDCDIDEQMPQNCSLKLFYILRSCIP